MAAPTRRLRQRASEVAYWMLWVLEAVVSVIEAEALEAVAAVMGWVELVAEPKWRNRGENTLKRR